MSTFLFWYALLISGVFIVSSLGKLGMKLIGKYDMTPKAVQLEELITMPFVLISVVGLYGYIQQVAIFSAVFWKIYFVLTILQIVVAFWLPKQQFLKKELPTKKFIVLNAIGTGIGIPLYYMLFNYAFVSFPTTS